MLKDRNGNPESFICHLNDRKVRRRAGIRKECTVGDSISFCPSPARPAFDKPNISSVSIILTIFGTYLRKMIYICCGIPVSLPLLNLNRLLIYVSRFSVSRTGDRRCWCTLVLVFVYLVNLEARFRVCA